MTKKQQTDLAELVSSYISLSQSVKAQQKQLEEQKAIIGVYAKKYGIKFIDGELVLTGPSGERVGMIKEVANSPKLVKVGSGLDLTDVEKTELLRQLPARYTARTFRVSLMRDEQHIEDLAAVLAKRGVEIEQTNRYDIKL